LLPWQAVHFCPNKAPPSIEAVWTVFTGASAGTGAFADVGVIAVVGKELLFASIGAGVCVEVSGVEEAFDGGVSLHPSKRREQIAGRMYFIKNTPKII